MPTDLMVPSIHLNGTSASEIIKQLEAVVDALRQTEEAMTAAAPNARDYYVQGPDAYKTACAQWADRLLKVSGVKEEVFAVLEVVVNREYELHHKK